ncbi:hypothetical protein FRX31_014388 [Thalictrum thalictroides]|uniref:Uncharacterized protein n=1 Tax=Thalictrum thalictroides TaxID=46969 RepID=A0A7J6WGG7_THATH|nr:hypothetical protein FRX31_014388 [Thalictrum thalictroides]
MSSFHLLLLRSARLTGSSSLIGQNMDMAMVWRKNVQPGESMVGCVLSIVQSVGQPPASILLLSEKV